MPVFADSLGFARRLWPEGAGWKRSLKEEPAVQGLLDALQPEAEWLRCDHEIDGFERVVLVELAARSQFDVLREVAGSGSVPDGNTFCLAGSGRGFHGHRDRSWAAVPGNLHASILLTPGRTIPHFGAALMALPAVAAALAIETAVPNAAPVGIKWVNDVVMGDAKVAGVIAHTRSAGGRVDQAVLGIGLNVESTPDIQRSLFVPRAGSLREVDQSVTQDQVLRALIRCLAAQSESLREQGPAPLLAAYRDRSVVVGRHVEIHPEVAEHGSLIAGRVAAIGDDLELVLDGRSAPVTRGRLFLTSSGNVTDQQRKA